ncbi:MAG: PrsW family intramembrane metalloprotease [Mogibacterium sp.]|nr:PrsW family intramembrane metalloprotease [Mogibacterium sp.]
MNYIENIFVCIAAPILISALCLRGSRRKAYMVFLLLGMTACLLSSYISSFTGAVMGLDRISTSFEVSPVVEEIMKFMPALFYLLVFEPRRESALNSIILISAGFATFENVCYLTENGASSISHLLIRGFGTGAMHIACGMIVAWGIYYLWDKLYLRAAGTIGLIAATIAYHGIFNLLVTQSGFAAFIGYMIPLASAIIIYYVSYRVSEEASF